MTKTLNFAAKRTTYLKSLYVKSPYSGALRSRREIDPASIESFSPASLPTTRMSSPTFVRYGARGISLIGIYFISCGSNLRKLHMDRMNNINEITIDNRYYPLVNRIYVKSQYFSYIDNDSISYIRSYYTRSPFPPSLPILSPIYQSLLDLCLILHSTHPKSCTGSL